MQQFKKNIIYTFGAQGIQLLQSILISLLVPKMLGVEQFGFWQLFIFYTQYGGFAHLGLIDGLYLRNGGKHYNELDFKSLGFQLRVLFFWLCLVMVPFAFLAYQLDDPRRIFVIITSCIYIVIYNIFSYFGYVLQCVNRIIEFSKGRYIVTMSFIICVIAFILLRCKTFYPYVIAYTLCSTLALIYYVYKDMDILYYALGHIPSVKPYLSEIIENIKSGIILMISNISGMLIIGFGRFLVDTEWGIKSFSIVSFSFMLVNFFMMFVNQASLVLFPELRRWSKDRVAMFSSKLDKTLSIVTPFALLMYIPAYYFIAAWLPKYSLSVTYLVYLLPICIFDTKMNLMYNTIFKVFNNVKYLLYCNLIALSVSIVLITTSIYALHSLLAVVISMLIAIACRGGIASYFSGKLVSLPGDLKRKVKEVLVILAFILIFTFCEINIASLLFFILFTIFIFMNRDFLKKAYLNVKKK